MPKSRYVYKVIGGTSHAVYGVFKTKKEAIKLMQEIENTYVHRIKIN